MSNNNQRRLPERTSQTEEILGNLDELVPLYERLFVNRMDVIWEQVMNGNSLKWEYTMRHVKQDGLANFIRSHLQGEATYALASYGTGGTSRWMCVDIDKQGGLLDLNDPQDVLRAMDSVLDCLAQGGVPKDAIRMEFSGSKGIHVWIFIHEAPVEHVQRFWQKFFGILPPMPHSIHIDYFPHQTTDPKEKDYGRCVKLPCGVHRAVDRYSCFINEQCEEILDMAGLLRSVQQWSLPDDLPPLKPNAKLEAKHKRRSQRKVITDPGQLPTRPPLTPNIQSLFSGCEFLRGLP